VSLEGLLVMPEETGHLNEPPHSVLVLGVAVFSKRPKHVQLQIEGDFRQRAGPLKITVTRDASALGVATH